jgi:peptidoglycan-N-acetylglucosamine deacetylase
MYRILQWFTPSLTWRKKTSEKIIHLTFDDGPVPDVTPWVLDQLKMYRAKATFFCIGDNVRKHQDIYKRVLAEGHRTGNHTFNHLNAWKSNRKEYIENVKRAGQEIQSGLFRPPYGKITPALIYNLKNNYQIIMWDVLSYDFDVTKDAAYCTDRVIKNADNGSIIVFHDSIKAWPRLEYLLPAVMKHFAAKGYRFETL